jgi:D-glycero-alpha-D-manno-heptose-7-phosphate kinase
LEANGLAEALEFGDEDFKLIIALLAVVKPVFGFNLFINSDFPVSSGLGGSAVVLSAILGCFNQLRVDQWGRHELAELAFQAERIYLGVAGGWQDQYATVFGGFNFIEFRMKENVVNPLRIEQNVILELEESLVLCDTGVSHNSGEIHNDQRHQILNSDKGVDQINAVVELSYKIRNQLLRGKLIDFGKSLHESWIIKKKFSNLITNSDIDAIYEGALANGAIGGKLLGAGGGGFFLFFVTPFKRLTLIDYLQRKKLKVMPFRFESDGLTSWSVREN